MALLARLGRLARGFLALFIGRREERSPEALLASACEDFRDKMTHCKLALARVSELAERLRNQIKAKTAKARDLERRILAKHAAGNLELAGSLALELQALKADLAIDSQELTAMEADYQANLRQARISQKGFEDKVRRLGTELSQVKIKEAQAEASAGLENFALEAADPGGSMNLAEEVVSRRSDDAAAKARVARDLADMNQRQARAGGSRAIEQAALAEFLASRDEEPPPVDRTKAATKETGPA